MSKTARILATMMIMIGLLAGAMISSIPVFADIAGEPDVYRLDYVVNASENDAFEVFEGENVGTNAEYILGVTHGWSDPWYDCNTGVIFSSVAVPNASQAQVLSAYLSFYSDGEGLRDFIAYIYGENAPNPEGYITGNHTSVSIRNKTASFVYVDADTEEGERWYIDVTPIVEELVASPNWSQSSNMSFLLMHDDLAEPYAFATGSYESALGTQPELTIYYAPTSETHYIIPFGHEETIDAGISQALNNSEDCAGYHTLNAQSNDYMLIGFQYYGMNYVGVSNNFIEEMGWIIARTIMGFNTSILPDDASISGATLFMNAYATTDEDSSIVVTKYTNNDILARLMEEGSPFFNRSYFVDNLGEFDTRDFPQVWGGGGIENPNRSSIVVKTTLSGIGSYINKDGFTLFGLRDINDINDICPDGITRNGSSTVFSLIPPQYYLSAYDDGAEPPSPSWLAIDIGDEEEPIIPTGPVSVMMTIQALIFTFGGILGIMALVLKPELASFTVRAGLLLGLTIITIVGVAMLESIIVTLT